MTQALPTTQSLSLLSPGLASAWVQSSYPSSVVPALRRVGHHPVAGHPAPPQVCARRRNHPSIFGRATTGIVQRGGNP